MDAHAVVGLAAATAAGLLANGFIASFVPSDKLVSGFPRWRWELSCMIQFVILPLLFGLAWRDSSGVYSMVEWLSLPASSLRGYERWYLYAIFASQSRDMIPKMPAAASFTMKLHHWVVVVACVLALLVPGGFGLFVCGTFVLELGSLTYNLRTLFPTVRALVPVYQLSMLASNVAAVCGGLYMLSIPGIPVWLKALYLVADVGVCIGRQEHALRDAGLISRKKKKKRGDSPRAPETASGG